MSEFIGATIAEVVGGIVNTWIIPSINELYKQRKLSKELKEAIPMRFGNYILRALKNNMYMNTVVFKNQQVLIDSLYIPLTVRLEGINKIAYEIEIDKYHDTFLPKYKKVLLIDTAGMGKSTLMKWLFISSIRQGKGIPIFIELKKLTNELRLIDLIISELNDAEIVFVEEYILKLIKRGNFIFYFDGYDEISNEDKKKVTEDIENFISKAGANLFIMSSREDSSLSCFGDFQRFKIKPLTKEEAYSLIEKYDKNGELSKELISKLKQDDNLKILDEFLSNPMMVSLLYKAYEYKKSIPYKKHTFYRQVYNALFDEHDLSKGGSFIHRKASNLDIEDFHRVLRALGYETLRLKKIIYERNEIINLIGKAKKKCPGITFKESEFLDDILQAVPLFIREGIYYKWGHKSFQEYFAAHYICDDIGDKKEDILLKLSNSPSNSDYYNVLDFCYDIDYKAFRKSVIYDLLKKYVKYCNEHYNQHIFPHVKVEALNLRRTVNFNMKCLITDALAEITNNYREIYEKVLEMSDEFWENNPNDIMLTQINHEGYIFLSRTSPTLVLINLLSKKNEKFICMKENKSNNKFESLNKYFKENKQAILYIDDNSNNIVNDKVFFEDTTNAVIKLFGLTIHPMGDIPYLELKSCIKLKETIEKDINSELEEDDFF